MRKGFVHIIEATFIAILILMFVLGFLPSIEKKETMRIAKESFRDGLKSLDQRNILRPMMYSTPVQLSAIKSNLASAVPQRINFTVGVTKQEVVSGTIFVNETNGSKYKGTLKYSADTSSLESAYLLLAFTTANDADFYFNGELIGVRDAASNVSLLDLSDRHINGTNTFEIIMPSQQTVARKISLVDTEKLEDVPSGTINVVSYATSGNNESYRPRELRVYLWND